MSDELNEETEPTNTVEDEVQEPETDVELDPVVLKAERDAAIAERDLQHKRATKAEAKLKEKPLTTNQSSPVTREDYDRLELKTEGYNSDEVDFLMQNGGRKALDNQIAMAGIEAIRKKAKSTEATPSGTAKSPVFQKFTEQDLKKMSLEELEKILPHA